MSGSIMDWPSALKRFRRRVGLKQQALADTLGCDQTAVSHWERGVDKPSLGFQRQLIQMMAEEQRTLNDLRLFAAVEKSPNFQVLFDAELRVLAGSDGFWTFYQEVSGRSPDVFNDFGVEENKSAIKAILTSTEGALVVEGEFTAQPKGTSLPVRMKGIGEPVYLSDGTVALRVGGLPIEGRTGDPINFKIFNFDDSCS